MWNRSDLCKNGEEYSQFSCECWKRHSYSFLRRPLAVMVSTRRYGVSFEANVFGYQMRRKQCLWLPPLNLRIGGKVVLKETLLPIVDKNYPPPNATSRSSDTFSLNNLIPVSCRSFLPCNRLDATLLFVRKARFLDPVGSEFACGKLVQFRSTLFPFAICYGDGGSNRQRWKSNFKALIDMPCGDTPVSDMQSWSDCQPIYILVFGSTNPKTLFWLNNACADGHWLSEPLKIYTVILVFHDCFVQYVAV